MTATYSLIKFSERTQWSIELRDVVKSLTAGSASIIKLSYALEEYKKQFKCQLKPETLQVLPFVELIKTNGEHYVICHHNNHTYKMKSQAIIITLDRLGKKSNSVLMTQVLDSYFEQYGEHIDGTLVDSMNHLIDVRIENDLKVLSLSSLGRLLLLLVEILQSVRASSISELENKINSNINIWNADIGYPDLKSVIASFNDVFDVHYGITNEITLNKHSVFEHEKNKQTTIYNNKKSKRLTSKSPIHQFNLNVDVISQKEARNVSVDMQKKSCHKTPKAKKYICDQCNKLKSELDRSRVKVWLCSVFVFCDAKDNKIKKLKMTVVNIVRTYVKICK